MDAAYPPSQNDRMMSAACHLSSLVGFGFVAPLVIYLTQRDRSGFVARHALQALFLQVFSILITVFVVLLCLLMAGAVVGVSMSSRSVGKEITAMSFGFIAMLVTGVVVPSLMYVVAMIVGVIECLQGKEAGLPLLGGLARSIHSR